MSNVTHNENAEDRRHIAWPPVEPTALVRHPRASTKDRGENRWTKRSEVDSPVAIVGTLMMQKPTVTWVFVAAKLASEG